MTTEYDILPELQALSGFSAPMASWIPRVAKPLMDLLPKCVDREHVDYRVIRVPRADGSVMPLFVFSPKGAEDEVLPCMFYAHGGAFMHAAVPTQYILAQQYVVGARCRLVCPDYRLSPMHAYPAGLTDCLDAFAWVVLHANELRIDLNRIIMNGDSAGGSLTLDAWLALQGMAKDAATKGEAPALPVPGALMLTYPVVDHRMRTASMQRFEDSPIWDARKNAIMWEYYLQGAAYISPLERAEEFAALNRAFIEVEEFDCLHDEGVEMARALEDVGVQTTLRDNLGTYHGFEFHHFAAITKESVAARVSWLREAFKEMNSQK